MNVKLFFGAILKFLLGVFLVGILIFLPAKNRFSTFFEYKALYGIEYGAGVT